MAISRMLQPRQQYGLGSFVKKAVKGVTGAVKSVASGIKSLASSDVGKLALLAGGAYGLNKFGLGAIKPGFLSKFPGASAIGEYLGTKGGKTLLMAGAGTLLGGVLSRAEQGDPEAMQVTRDVGALRNYLTSGYTNLGYSAEEIPALVEKDLSEYTKLGGYATGGRVGYSKGTNRDEEQPIKELKDADPNLRAGPDWYMKRIEALMYEYDMDYDEAAEIAFDSNKYFDLMPDEFATGGRVQYGEGSPFKFSREPEPKTDLMKAAEKMAGEKGIPVNKALKMLMEKNFQKDVTYRAMGGRVKYSNGTPSESDRVKELMDDGYTFGEAVKKVMEEQKQRENKAYGSKPEDNAKRASGIMNIPLNKNKAGVTELDMRENGGFIPPVGVKEKADDIPAMLSNNEFVFTADAVRGMGNGNVNVGAQRMYDMMKKLENRMA